MPLPKIDSDAVRSRVRKYESFFVALFYSQCLAAAGPLVLVDDHMNPKLLNENRDRIEKGDIAWHLLRVEADYASALATLETASGNLK